MRMQNHFMAITLDFDTWPSESKRLEPDEGEILANFFFKIHDHRAMEPATPTYWIRTKGVSQCLSDC